jgi:hypothetical protein
MAEGEIVDFSGPDYVDMLRAIHAWKKPKTYLEIAHGSNRTIELSECRTIAIGYPAFIDNKIPDKNFKYVSIFNMDSISFFENIEINVVSKDPIDLAFIDGVHLCEIALAEFYFIEKNARSDSVIALHDCLPLEAGITGRNAALATPQDPKRATWWLGDVWRTALFLKRNRPDLVIRAYGARPSGLVCVTGLDPKRPFSKDDVARAKAEMLQYDLGKIGIRGLFAELDIQGPTLDTGTLGKDLARAAIGGTKPQAPDRVATLARAATPHGLKTATFSNAKLQAFRGPVLRFQGGPVPPPDDDSFRHRRGGKPADGFETALAGATKLSGEYIYAGPLYHHFGHFLAEFVHRILPSHQTFGPHPFILLASKGANKNFDKIPTWIRQILEFLGITPNNCIIINQDTEVETLHVAETGSHLGAYAESSYLDFLKDFSRNRIQDYAGRWPSHRKIYVSRSGIEHGGNFLGERYLEALLRDVGYHIMKPETLSFAHQAWLYMHAEEIIFCEGSACHGCELFGSGTLGRVFLLAKRELNTFTRVLRPRSREFHASHGHPIVGTLGRNQDGVPLAHVGVHLLDPPPLIKALHEGGFADLRTTFSRDAYLKAASADLLAYIRFHLLRDAKAAEPALGPADIADLTAAYQNLAPEIA